MRTIKPTFALPILPMGESSFKNVKISETPFTPVDSAFFGDYNNIAAHKGIITPIWTRMDDGKTSVWTAVIKQSELIKESEVASQKEKEKITFAGYNQGKKM